MPFLYYIKNQPITYTLTGSSSVIDEGVQFTVTLQTTGVQPGTLVPYTIDGLTLDGISVASLTGTFTVTGTVSNGTATASFTTADLFTEGLDPLAEDTETISLSLNNGFAAISIDINDTIGNPTYSLTSSAASVDEGNSVTITLNTQNVQPGTVVPYTIIGELGAIFTGTFTVAGTYSNGSANIQFTATEDSNTEGPETFTIALDNGQATTQVLINDTSRTPVYSLDSSVAEVNEGVQFTITLTTANVQPGTLVPYTITGVTSADLNGASLTGAFTVAGTYSNGTATASFTTADLFTEGLESIVLSLNDGQAVAQVFINYTVTIITGPTSLLLKGEGTNNQTNNVFLDSSSFATTITRNGNATQGSITPFRPTGEWSVQFNGSTDRLTFPAQTLSGDFTIECWFLQTAKSSNYIPLVCSDSGSYNFPLILDYQGSGFVGLYLAGGVPVANSGAKVFDIGVWNHIATVRSGTNISVYVNGTRVISISGSTSVTVDTIGGYNATGYFFNGLISNMRVTNGSALYTGSSFAVTTSPLTSSAQTAVLTCQSNRFVENSSNKVIGIQGSPIVSLDSPFAQTAYSPETHGGSIYLDGTGDKLQFQAITLSGDFTVQSWVYLTPVAPSANPVFMSGSPNFQFVIDTSTSGGPAQGAIGVYDGSVFTTSANGLIRRGTWCHVAWSRQGTTLRMFVNGKLAGTTSTGVGFIVSTIGGFISPGYDINGYISGAEILGSALYTADFTPPAVPKNVPTATTRLLLNGTNAGVVDTTGKNLWETIGTAKISTTQKKYGTSSIEFNGSTDYIKAPSNNGNFAFGTGDFTVEGWIYRNTNNSNACIFALDAAINGTGQTFYIIYFSGVSSPDRLSIVTAGGATNAITSSISTPAGTWQHIAVTRQSGTFRIFINGVLGATATIPTVDIRNGNSAQIGAHNGFYPFNGFMDDIRITKGTALYTTNFTPPAAL